MVDHANFSEDRPERLAAARGLVPHPLFPRHDGRPEDRDIRFVSFRRRLPDGRVEHCPDDIPAHEVRSWADVTGSWGGGEYQAVGKDELRQVVAVYPDGDDDWILFNFESRPFGSRNGSRPGGITQAPAVRDAPSPPAQAPSPAPWPPFAPHYAHPHAQPPPAYAMVASGPAPSPPNPHGSPAPATLIATPYGYVVATPAHAHAPPAPAAPPLPPGYAPAAGYAPGAPAVGYAPGTPAVGYAPAQPDPAPLYAYAYGTPAPAPGYAHALPVSVAAASQAHAIPAPQPAQAMHEPLAALIKELIREVRALRDPPSAAHAPPPALPVPPPPPGPSQSETMMATMLNSQAELVRGVVTAALGSRSADTAAQPAPEPAAQALQMLRAIKELGLPGPGQAPPSMTERLHELRVLKELTTPAPPAAPAPVASEIGEIFSGITTLMQAEAAKVAATSAAEPRPAPQERRPPPPPRYLLHVPGIGLVDVVHPEPPAAPAPSLPARADNGLVLDAIKRDPALRASVLAALGIDSSAVGSSPTPIAAPIAAPAPVPSAPPAPSPMAPQPPRVDPPAAPSPVASTPVPVAPAPTPPSAPAFIAPAPTEPSPPPPPSAPASTPASDERVLGAEPTEARARAPRAITDDDRMRAVYALQTIARMPPDQRRAELAKLPGMEGNVDMFVQVLQNVDDISPDAWTRFAAALPPDAVRVLVYGPGA